MKTCPHCAETDLQDAAIVCKHCGREVPLAPVATDPVVADLKKKIGQNEDRRRILKWTLGIVGALAVLYAINLYRPGLPPRTFPPPEPSLPVTVTTNGITIDIENTADDAIFMLDVRLNGRYKATLYSVPPKSTERLPLLAFATDAGQRFQPLATKPTTINVSGAINGVRRDYSGRFK